MQKIFIEKPYEFVRPRMSGWLPHLLNRKFIHASLLWATESVVGVESRGAERLKKSIDAGHAVIMIGNHPRVSDPVVVFDLIRKAKTPMFAMASWHLFNKSRFSTQIIRLFGGYSVNREGLDRESINFSVSMLQDNVRPLLMFPEGATTRTNDSLMPFLDGPTFIARTAARRRHKQGLKTVIHPIAFRYIFTGDFESELNRIMQPVEEILEIKHDKKPDPVQRVSHALHKLVLKKEADFEIVADHDSHSYQRRQQMADHVMEQAEARWFGKRSDKDITNRIRDVRSYVFPELLSNDNLSTEERQMRWRDLERTYLAWQMATYPQEYLAGDPSVDRILEIAAKILEDLTDKPRKNSKQKIIIEACDPIDVPPEKHRGSEPDPLLEKVGQALMERLD